VRKAQEREDYHHESKNLLYQLQWPTEVKDCQTFNCTDDKHLEEIENLYAELTSACWLLHPLQLKQQVKRMKVNLTFLVGTRWSNQNTKLQRQPSGYGQSAIDPKLVAYKYTGTWLTQKKTSNIHCGNAANMLKFIRLLA